MIMQIYGQFVQKFGPALLSGFDFGENLVEVAQFEIEHFLKDFGNVLYIGLAMIEDFAGMQGIDQFRKRYLGGGPVETGFFVDVIALVKIGPVQRHISIVQIAGETLHGLDPRMETVVRCVEVRINKINDRFGKIPQGTVFPRKIEVVQIGRAHV